MNYESHWRIFKCTKCKLIEPRWHGIKYCRICGGEVKEIKRGNILMEENSILIQVIDTPRGYRVRKTILSPQKKVVCKYGLTTGGEWVLVGEGEMYPDNTYFEKYPLMG